MKGDSMKAYMTIKNELDLNIMAIKRSILLEIAATEMLANWKLRKQKSYPRTPEAG